MATNEQDELREILFRFAAKVGITKSHAVVDDINLDAAVAALLAWRDHHTKEAVERGAEILEDIYDEGNCRFDHHGYCQAHGWMETDPKCPHQRAKEYLAELAAPQQSTSPDGSAE